MQLYFLANSKCPNQPSVSAVLTQVQDNELGASLGIANLVLSHTLIKTFIRLHQSQHLQIMLILGKTQKNMSEKQKNRKLPFWEEFECHSQGHAADNYAKKKKRRCYDKDTLRHKLIKWILRQQHGLRENWKHYVTEPSSAFLHKKRNPNQS